MITKEVITEICGKYGINVTTIGEVINTSRGDEDERFNYPVNNEYMLKINSASFIEERFLQNIAELIERYRSIQVHCPRLIKSKEENYIHKIVHNNKEYSCYIEEYAHYKTADSSANDLYQIKKEMMWHLGKLASLYTDVGLVKTRSMWSIIDLAPLDIDIDEKQENINALIECLNKKGYTFLATKVGRINEELRNEITSYFEKLPRCVYQGDLNSTNVLIDGHDEFVGVIDFNIFGTEVNINCFINETMYYLNEEDFDELSVDEIFEKMNQIQNELLDEIFRYYTLNNIEKHCFSFYKKIIYLSFYPNVMLWIQMMKKESNRDKVIGLLESIVRM